MHAQVWRPANASETSRPSSRKGAACSPWPWPDEASNSNSGEMPSARMQASHRHEPRLPRQLLLRFKSISHHPQFLNHLGMSSVLPARKTTPWRTSASRSATLPPRIKVFKPCTVTPASTGQSRPHDARRHPPQHEPPMSAPANDRQIAASPCSTSLEPLHQASNSESHGKLRTYTM